MAVVSLANKPVNALSSPLISELTQTLQQLAQDESVEGVILASSCNNVFSAGLMLTELDNPQPHRITEYWSSFERLWSELYVTPLATVAEVNGAAPAGGAILALSCDERVMGDSPKCRIGLTEVAVGLTLPQWTIQLMERQLGARTAELHLGKASMLGSQDALRTGWVDHVAAMDDLRDQSEKCLTEWLAMPPLTRAATKIKQRKAVAELVGPRSTQAFKDAVFSEECQQTVAAMLAAMNKKKK